MFYVFMFCVSNTFFTGGEAPSHLQCRRPGGLRGTESPVQEARGLTGDRVPCAVGGGTRGCNPRKIEMFCDGKIGCSSQTNNKQQPMRVLIKFQGFKDLKISPEFTMDVDPTETIEAITIKLEQISGVPAHKVSVITGLILGNPSGSFKKLDKSVSVSDHGLRNGSTLMVFIPIGQQQDSSSDIVVATPPPPAQQPKSRVVCVGKAEYRASASEPIKSGDIMAVVGDKANKKSKTTLLFEGVEYANAQEWLKMAFKNSGRSCCVQFEKPQNTPRPTRYVPPSDKNKFGCYV